MSAAEVLQAAAIAALGGIEGLGIYDAPPLQAVPPHAVVEVGPERDWGHKSGVGRVLRLAVVLRDRGERPARLRRLMGESEAALLGMSGALAGWQVVNLRLVRASASAERAGSWVGLVEIEARLLAA